MRNGVEAPAQRTRAHIECPDISGRRRMRLRLATTEHDQVFINDPRCGECDRALAVIPAMILPQIDAAVFTEARDGVAVAWVECVETTCDAREQPHLSA